MNRVRRVRRRADELLDRIGRGRLAVAVLAVVVVAVGTTAAYQLTREGRYRITARFTATPGLYTGNDVDVLGVPTGTVESITPRSDGVDVVLSLPDHVHVPADARAVLMAPNPVSDRFVELTPAWTPGTASLAHGAVLGRSRTVVPLELDQIYSSLSALATSLGPRGANAHGALSETLHAFAQLADGNGADVHAAIESISAALPALTRDPDQLAELVTSLDSLTGKLATRNDTIDHLYDDLSTVTGQFADERTTIAAAVANLQRGLVQVAGFLQQNKAHITGSVTHLNTVLSAVLREQKALETTFDDAPLGFQNFNRAIDLDAPCASATGAPNSCAGLWSRMSTPRDAASFIKQYCGDSVANSLVPIIVGSVTQQGATATDTTCAAQFGLLQGRTGPPGTPATPDLALQRYLGQR